MATAPGKNALLTLAEIAEIIGVEPATTALYHHRANRNRREGIPRAGDFPEPDQMVGRIPTWKRRTVETWQASRPSATWKRESDAAATE